MNGSSHRPRGELLEGALLILFLAALLIWRLFLISFAPINPDEMNNMGNIFRFSSGLLPYLDFGDMHPPLFYVLLSPVFQMTTERPDILYLFRWINLAFLLIYSAGFLLVVRRLFDGMTALWALGFAHSFEFFILRSVHFRPDFAAYTVFFFTLLFYLRREDSRPLSIHSLLLGLGFGLSVSIHVNLAFPFAAVLLWNLIQGVEKHETWKAFRQSLIIGLAAIVTFFCNFIFVYGGKTSEVFQLLQGSIPFAHHMVSFEATTFQIFHAMLLRNLLIWVLFSVAFFGYTITWFRGKIHDPSVLLVLLCAYLGLVFLLLQQQIFEQYYLALVIFGSMLVARGARNVRLRSVLFRGLPAGVLLALALIVYTSFSAFETYNMVRIQTKNEMEYQKYVGEPRVNPEGALTAESVRVWLAPNLLWYSPFKFKPNQQRFSQIRFLLKHASSEENVLSDWLNPPYRMLPCKFYNGLMISRFYESAEIPHYPQWVEFLHHYDPFYDPSAPTVATRMIRLLQGTRAKIILLEGTFGLLFFDSEEFRNYVDSHYRFVFDPASYSVFAVRKDV